MKLFVMAFVLLAISQSAGAQVTTAQIREEIAKGECETAQSLYNVYKAMNGANKTIEREIADCKTDSSSDFGETGTANGHEYVDLGLPSGTLWATCNVGASKPEDYGKYFAWGETKTKSTYRIENYKYANGDLSKLTKYCYNSNYGNNNFADDMATLQGEDDPATANWGSGWYTPSKNQWDELLENTTNWWTTWNGTSGRLFVSKKNGQTLFLPAAGFRNDDDGIWVGSRGLYWSRSLNTKGYPMGYPGTLSLQFHSDDCQMSNTARSNGCSVRPVREE